MNSVKPFTREEIDFIRSRMDVWSDYGPDPTDTILRLIATIDEARAGSLDAAIAALGPEPPAGQRASDFDSGVWDEWVRTQRILAAALREAQP